MMMADDSPLVNFLKVAAGLHAKDASRYGDARQAGFGTPNQEEAFITSNPPRTHNTPGYDTDESSSRQPNPGSSRRNVYSASEKANKDILDAKNRNVLP